MRLETANKQTNAAANERESTRQHRIDELQWQEERQRQRRRQHSIRPEKKKLHIDGFIVNLINIYEMTRLMR